MCVLIQRHVCPHTPCPHTPMYVSSYCYVCVLILLYTCSSTAICALTPICLASSHSYMSSVLMHCYISSVPIHWRILTCIRVRILLMRVLTLVLMCPHPSTHVSSPYCICVLTLVHMCPHPATCVLTLIHMCPHTSTCALALLHMCPHTSTSVLTLVHMCPHPTTYVSSH